MAKTFKKLFWSIFFVVVLCVVGYGLYWYFSDYRPSHTITTKLSQQTNINNEYLDTLVVDINNILKHIDTKIEVMSQNFKHETVIFTIMSSIMLLNLIIVVILCLIVMSIRSKLKKILDNNDK